MHINQLISGNTRINTLCAFNSGEIRKDCVIVSCYWSFFCHFHLCSFTETGNGKSVETGSTVLSIIHIIIPQAQSPKSRAITIIDTEEIGQSQPNIKISGQQKCNFQWMVNKLLSLIRSIWLQPYEESKYMYCY